MIFYDGLKNTLTNIRILIIALHMVKMI
jgi:hypothetical protein